MRRKQKVKEKLVITGKGILRIYEKIQSVFLKKHLLSAYPKKYFQVFS